MNAARAIIVEDEGIVALHTHRLLVKLGYEVVAVVASGEEALKKVAELRPDVVLMDIHIAGELDGIETAARIPVEIGAAAIYVTAYSEDTTLERARTTKPHGYLIKPYAERELHAAIQMGLDRQHAEIALRASEDRLRSIFNAVSEGIFILDATGGTFIEVNEPGCRMFGYSADELIGSNLQAISSGAPPYTQSDALGWITKAATSGQPQRFGWQSKAKDGRIFPTDISLRIASIGGRAVVLSILRDLTEREAMEGQLRQLQKMEAVGQLTGGMAHDFNNLLSVIIGNLEMLRDAHPDNREVEEFAGEALEAALGGADLTRRLLAFARRQPLQPQRIDLKRLVGGTAKLLKRVLGENIEVALDFADGPCSVLVDRAQVEAALTNLATNARDAMPAGGKLLIATGVRHLDADYAAANPGVTPGAYATIEVTDTGSGIPPEVIGRIFDPFFTTKERDRGTGLGLSMVFGFLKQSGGHVTVYSEVGVGSTFRLYLPRVVDAEATMTVPIAANPKPNKGEVVLVVEDNAPLRRIAVKQLGELGYHVLAVQGGSEALATLASTPVDALFTDVVMPGGMDGLQLARTAKDRWPDLRVILTSGYPATRLKEDLAAPDFPLLNKPYGKAALARIIREALDQPGIENDSSVARQ